MSSDKITEMLLKAFFRFLVPGMIFIVFVFLIPSYFLVNLLFTDDKIWDTLFFPGVISFVNNPTLFIVSAISVGLLLDLSRFYSVLSKYFIFPDCKNSLWYSLKGSIVKASGISLDAKNLDKKYKNRVERLAYQIHSLFVRIKYPEIDRKIENSRAYPDMLSMSLLSMIISFVIFFISLVIKIYNKPVLSDFMYIVVIVIAVIIIFVGHNKVKREFEKINELTNFLISDVFAKDDSKDEENRVNFFKTLSEQEDSPIEIIDRENKWRVKCCDLSMPKELMPRKNKIERQRIRLNQHDIME